MALSVTLFLYLFIFFISFLFISLLFSSIIYYYFVTSFNYLGVLGSFDVLGLGLFGVRIDKRWNFNGCGGFCGEIFWGVGVCFWGGWKWWKRLGLLGRAWVSSLPKFFLGKYFQFWKPPPYFCINS